MSVIHKMVARGAKVQFRMLDALRHKRAFEIASEPAEAAGFGHMEDYHYALLVTFKRSGEAVPSPVLFGLRDGKVYFRTDASVGKVKRIRSNPRILVGPSNMRGKPRGPLGEGRARRLHGEEADRAWQILRDSYTVPMKALESSLDRMPIEIAYFEVTPTRVGPVSASGGPKSAQPPAGGGA